MTEYGLSCSTTEQKRIPQKCLIAISASMLATLLPTSDWAADYFTFELAKLTGPGGKVFAADTNERLLVTNREAYASEESGFQC